MSALRLLFAFFVGELATPFGGGCWVGKRAAGF